MPARAYRLPGPLGLITGAGAALIVVDLTTEPAPGLVPYGIAAIVVSALLAWLSVRGRRA